MTRVEMLRATVAKKRGVDLEAGDKVWIQQSVGMYDDGAGVGVLGDRRRLRVRAGSDRRGEAMTGFNDERDVIVTMPFVTHGHATQGESKIHGPGEYGY